ncbi:MAG: hypothetical protein SGARI_004850, partial [Bacillariaceae sp.]
MTVTDTESYTLSHPHIVDGLSKVQTLVQEWNQWAAEPLLGNYVFQTSNENKQLRKSHSSDMTIHFPILDLETVLGNKAGNTAATTNILHTKQHPDTVVLTRRGNKYSQGEVPLDAGEDALQAYRQPNQDRVVLLRPTSNANDFWMGLFDGHGSYGHCISHYCSLELAKKICLQKWDDNVDDTTIKDSIQKTYLAVNNAMPRLFGSGTTAISIWKRQNKLYISNLGDSVAFVASYEKKNPLSTTNIIYQNKAHKPDDPEERKRIEAAGGQVEDAPFEGASARLLIPMPDGINIFGLAMSRSLGDHDGLAVGLSAEPTTDILQLDKLDFAKKEYFVVAATDGMIDHGRLKAVQ